MRKVLFVTIINILMMNLFGQEKKPDFNFPKTVIKNAEAQLKDALANSDGQSAIDALVKYGIAQGSISDENFDDVVKKTNDVIQKENREDYKAILRYLLSTIYSSHQDVAESDSVYALAMGNESELRSHKIEEYPKIIKSDVLGRRLCPTLYDFLRYHKEGDSYLWSILDEGEMQGYKLRYSYTQDKYDELKEYLEKYPNSPWVNDIKNAIANIERQDAHVTYPSQVHSSDKIKVKISSTNAKDVNIVVSRIPDVPKNKYSVKRSLLKRIASQKVHFEHTETLFKDEQEILLDPLPSGKYHIDVIVNGSKPEGNDVYFYDALTISDTSEFTFDEYYDEYKTVFTVDIKSGKMIKEEKRKKEYFTAKDKEEDQKRVNESLSINTDLAIYRPGETLNYTVICTEASMSAVKPLPNRHIEVVLRDTYGKEAGKDTLLTDQFGQLKGSFQIPTDRTNGMFRIVANDITIDSKHTASSSRSINVSEYKLPTFYIDLSKNKDLYEENKDIEIVGRCVTHSGVPLVFQDVSLEINSTMWWTRRSYLPNDQKDVHIFETVKTNHNGEFSYTIKADQVSRSRHYEVSATTTNDAGETQNASCSFFVGQKIEEPEEEEQQPIDSVLWLPKDGQRVDKDGVAHIAIGTARHIHVCYLAKSRTGVIALSWLEYKPGIHDFAIQIPDGADQYVDMTLMCYYEGEYHNEHVRLANPASQRKVELKITSFRDKIIPGTRETWQFSVAGKGIDKRNAANGRLMLEVISEAVNKISPNGWSFNTSLLSARNSYLGGNSIGDRTLWGYWQRTPMKTVIYQIPYLYMYDRWFDWGSMYGRRRLMNFSTKNVADEAMVVGFAKMSKSAAAPMPDVVEMAVVEDNAAIAEEEGDFVFAKKEAPSADNGRTAPDFSNIMMRESDTKVALWQPMVEIGADGIVTVQFDAPLDNTTWRLNALAFDKEMTASNLVSQLIVAQRPVMVTPSLPRFLRDGDKTQLMANVLNAGEETITADVLIELFNPRTDEILKTKNMSVTIAAGDMKAVGIDCEADERLSFLGYRIKAAVNGAGDGEQQMIPILPSVTPVVETIPFYLNPSDKDTIIDISKFPAEAQLTLEYCNNPVWYCLSALPTIYDKDACTATAIAHSLYAVALSENIKTGYNSDFKVSDEERYALIKKLCALQNADGGISWFDWNGRESSEYVTHDVLELFGELRYIGIEIDSEDLRNLISRALRYYEERQLKNLSDIQKHLKKVDYSIFAPYLYLRTLYPKEQYRITEASAGLLAKTLRDTEKNWRDFSHASRAFVAQALWRNDKKNTARLIVESLRQFAVNDPRRGMFWDNLQQFGYRWYPRTALTAHMLEAFNEIDPRTDEIDQIRKWMLLEKQTTDWGTSSMAAEATFSLISTGTQWLRNTESAEYYKKEISSHSTQHIAHNTASPAWGAIYAKYPSTIKETKAFKLQEIELTKELRKHDGGKITNLKDIHVGDKLQVVLTVTTDRDMDLVTIKDNRAACFEPADKLSGYQFSDSNIKSRQSIGYYNDIKDTENRIMIQFLPKGSHVITYDVYVTNSGEFCTGLADITCEYAPQFTAHTAGDMILVK